MKNRIDTEWVGHEHDQDKGKWEVSKPARTLTECLPEKIKYNCIWKKKLSKNHTEKYYVAKRLKDNQPFNKTTFVCRYTCFMRIFILILIFFINLTYNCMQGFTQLDKKYSKKVYFKSTIMLFLYTLYFQIDVLYVHFVLYL